MLGDILVFFLQNRLEAGKLYTNTSKLKKIQTQHETGESLRH